MFFILFLFVSFSSHAAKHESCFGRPPIQKIKSQRLKALAAQDQADRSGDYDSIDWNKVGPRDLKRRIEVGQMFGAGCISTAEDYASAAIIYQHGNTADHAYQSFIWSLKGVELGDESQKWLLGAGLDRYLTRIGYKQLFATQYARPSGEKCWCLEQVEDSFPDQRRSEYVKKSLSDALLRLREMNKGMDECASTTYCKQNLKPTPAGKIPGFW